MQTQRKLMDSALRATLVPFLRELGFAGRPPHFRRKLRGRNEFVSFMFHPYGGSFYLEAGVMSEQRHVELQHYWAEAGKELPYAELNMGHCMPEHRARLGGPSVCPNSDHWFVFGTDRFAGTSLNSPSHYVAIASQALAAIQGQLEPFYAQLVLPQAEA